MCEKITKDSEVSWFTKEHECECGCVWQDEWDCLCDDECPDCGKDVPAGEYEEELCPVPEVARGVGQTVESYVADYNSWVSQGE